MRASGHSLNTSLCSSPVPLIVWPLTPPSAPPFTQKRELSRHQDCSDVPHRLCGVLGLLVKAQKSSLPRQAQAGRGPPPAALTARPGGGPPEKKSPPHCPPPRTLLKSQVTTVLTDNAPGVPSALAGPLLVTGERWWSQSRRPGGWKALGTQPRPSPPRHSSAGPPHLATET